MAKFAEREILREINPLNFKLSNKGCCVTCDSETTSYSNNEWLRDYYICTKCGSILRERALMFCIERYYPNWRDLHIHESSPSSRGASTKLKNIVKTTYPFIFSLIYRLEKLPIKSLGMRI